MSNYNFDEVLMESIILSLTDSDYEAIMLALIDRFDSIELINSSRINYERIDDSNMYIPVPVSNEVRDGAYEFVNKKCAKEIVKIVKKYI